MKTFTLKAGDLKPEWHLIDAENIVLGRLASHVARLLRGKHKPTFTPSLPCGDHVVIINADKIAVTGQKLDDKVFYWHTGYPGGIKERTLKQTLTSRFPERALLKAVERMMPRGPLGREQMRQLHVYAGSTHPHDGQTPKPMDFGALNPKNKRG